MWRGRKKRPEVRRSRSHSEVESPPLSNYSYSSRAANQHEANVRKPVDLSKPPQLPHKPISRVYLLQRGITLIILIIATVELVNLLSLSSVVKLVVLNKPNEQTYLQPLSVYSSSANQLLRQSIWNHSKITVEASSIARQIEDKYPELTGVSLAIQPFSHTPILNIDGAIPGLILINPQGSYVVDDSGRVLAKISSGSQIPTNIPTVTDQSGLSVSVKSQALPASFVIYIKTVVAELSAKQYQVSSMVLPQATSELDVHLAGQPYFVKFNLEDTDPKGEAGAFLAVINNLKQQNITPTQYVDVRVPGRAYYL